MPPINPPNSRGKEWWHAEFMQARTKRPQSAPRSSQNAPQNTTIFMIRLPTLRSSEELAGYGSVVCEYRWDLLTMFTEQEQRLWAEVSVSLQLHSVSMRKESDCKHERLVFEQYDMSGRIQSRSEHIPSHSLQGLIEKEAIVG